MIIGMVDTNKEVEYVGVTIRKELFVFINMWEKGINVGYSWLFRVY